jgi:hypothetical protein
MRSVILARGEIEWSDGELHENCKLLQVTRSSTETAAIPTRLLYLVHPTLRSLVIRLHSQLNAFTHFVLSIDRPITHPGADMSLGVMTDPRATMLAKANVVDVLGKEGVDLVEWGKTIEALPRCKPTRILGSHTLTSSRHCRLSDDRSSSEAFMRSFESQHSRHPRRSSSTIRPFTINIPLYRTRIRCDHI